MLAGAQKISAYGLPPGQTLDQLVGLHVSFAVDDRDLLSVWIQDRRSLPAEDFRRIRDRQVQYVGEWTLALGRLRPDLGTQQLETIVYAAIGVINSVAFHDSGLPREALDPLLSQLARAVLKERSPEANGDTRATTSVDLPFPGQGVSEPDA
jgi:hypothetical protein